MFSVVPKEKTKWYKLRTQLSRFLFYLGKKVDPRGLYTNSYLAEQLLRASMDQIIYGKGAIQVKHIPFDEIQKDKEVPTEVVDIE